MARAFRRKKKHFIGLPEGSPEPPFRAKKIETKKGMVRIRGQGEWHDITTHYVQVITKKADIRERNKKYIHWRKSKRQKPISIAVIKKYPQKIIPLVQQMAAQRSKVAKIRSALRSKMLKSIKSGQKGGKEFAEELYKDFEILFIEAKNAVKGEKQLQQIQFMNKGMKTIITKLSKQRMGFIETDIAWAFDTLYLLELKKIVPSGTLARIAENMLSTVPEEVTAWAERLVWNKEISIDRLKVEALRKLKE